MAFDELPTEDLPSGLAGQPPPEALIPAVPDVAGGAGDEDAWPPPVPAEAPGNIGAPAPLPTEAAVTPAAPPAADGPPVKSGETEATIAAQAEQDRKRAAIEADRAAEEARIAREHDEDERLAHADYLERRAQMEADFDRAHAEFTKARITDPRSKDIGRARLAVIFGALGSAQSAAGGGDARNHGLEAIRSRWENDLALQKASIDLLKDNAVMARSRLDDVDAGRAKLRNEANARHVARLDSALKKGVAQLKALGMSQVDIDADRRVQTLRAARAAAAVQAEKDADDHALKRARITYMGARAARERAKAAAAGKGGGAGQVDALAQLAAYARDNKGDNEGLYRLAGKLNIKDPAKAVEKAINQSKTTESQDKSAEFGRAGLRSLAAIEKAGYTPTEAEAQKWLDNQRDVYLGQEAGKGGGLGALVGGKAAGLAQSVKLLAKSETEGLSPQAARYFADIRRVMEPLGRAKSGAAISQSEWTNFFNQYGPQSSGGLAAARADLEDLVRASGGAGRQLAAGDKKEAPAPAKERPSDDELTRQARQVLAAPSRYSPIEVKRAGRWMETHGR